MALIVSLLAAQHKRDSVEKKLAVLLVFLVMALSDILPFLCSRLVAGSSNLSVAVVQSN